MVLLHLLSLLFDLSSIFLTLRFLGYQHCFWFLGAKKIMPGTLICFEHRIGTESNNSSSSEANPDLLMNVSDFGKNVHRRLRTTIQMINTI